MEHSKMKCIDSAAIAPSVEYESCSASASHVLHGNPLGDINVFQNGIRRITRTISVVINP